MHQKKVLLLQYVECFAQAGIQHIHLEPSIFKESSFDHPIYLNKNINITKNDRLLDPEEDDLNQITNTQYLMTLIKENAKLAHLLKRKTEEERVVVEERSGGGGYFSPDLKVFSTMLNHDLVAITNRYVNNFEFYVRGESEKHK